MNTDKKEIDKLRQRISELEQTIAAIQEGDVEAVVVKGTKGHQIYSQENTQIMTILESISDAFISFDNDWRYVYINSKAEKLLDKTRNDIISKQLEQVFPFAGRNPVYSMMRKAKK